MGDEVGGLKLLFLMENTFQPPIFEQILLGTFLDTWVDAPKQVATNMQAIKAKISCFNMATR